MTSEPEQSTRRVLEAIARHLGVGPGQLKGRDRTARVVEARWVAILLLRDRCQLSYRELGVVLGRRRQTVHRSATYASKLPGTRELVEHVDRMMRQEAPKTLRAVVDIEEVFARAREDAGAPAKLTRGRPR